jgi:hypothetical protein
MTKCEFVPYFLLLNGGSLEVINSFRPELPATSVMDQVFPWSSLCLVCSQLCCRFLIIYGHKGVLTSIQDTVEGEASVIPVEGCCGFIAGHLQEWTVDAWFFWMGETKNSWNPWASSSTRKTVDAGFLDFRNSFQTGFDRHGLSSHHSITDWQPFLCLPAVHARFLFFYLLRKG